MLLGRQARMRGGIPHRRLGFYTLLCWVHRCKVVGLPRESNLAKIASHQFKSSGEISHRPFQSSPPKLNHIHEDPVPHSLQPRNLYYTIQSIARGPSLKLNVPPMDSVVMAGHQHGCIIKHIWIYTDLPKPCFQVPTTSNHICIDLMFQVERSPGELAMPGRDMPGHATRFRTPGPPNSARMRSGLVCADT